MTSAPRILWQALLVLVLGLLAWRITALGLAAAQIPSLNSGGAAAARQIQIWYPGQADALYYQGLALVESDPASAANMFAAAYRNNPTNPRPLLGLAALALAKGDSERADRLMAQVDLLRPGDARWQRDLGHYWLQRQKPDLSFRHWSRAIAGDPGLAPSLYANFRQLLQDPNMDAPFALLTRDPPNWWTDFFLDTAHRAQDLNTLRHLYQLRREAPQAPLTQSERQAFYERLLRDGLIEEAYLAWVNSLSPVQRQHLGLLYNGSFELPLSGRGFDWRITAIGRVDVSRARFEGESKNALRLSFNLLRTPFSHVAQSLLLAPGAYEVTGVSRSLDLLTEGGFRWQVLCQAPDQTLLGESGRLFGSDTWSSFRFEFEVPPTCTFQQLRLTTVDDSGRDILTNGELWFDEIRLHRRDDLSPLARGKLDASRIQEQLATDHAGIQPAP